MFLKMETNSKKIMQPTTIKSKDNGCGTAPGNLVWLNFLIKSKKLPQNCFACVNWTFYSLHTYSFKNESKNTKFQLKTRVFSSNGKILRLKEMLPDTNLLGVFGGNVLNSKNSENFLVYSEINTCWLSRSKKSIL